MYSQTRNTSLYCHGGCAGFAGKRANRGYVPRQSNASSETKTLNSIGVYIPANTLPCGVYQAEIAAKEEVAQAVA
jgi:hypothetical protein